MKYSQPIGIVASVAVAFICFLPWAFIQGPQITITGFDAGGSNLGKPGLMNVLLSFLCLVFFALPKIWAKRTNIILATFNFAWAVRNFLILSICEAGECPEKKVGLYLLVIDCLIILIMSLLPNLKVKANRE